MSATVEWSVLVKCVAPDEVPPITDALRYMLLDALPGNDKWFQYPPASGRGNGFEVRFWIPAEDAADAASKADRAVSAVLRSLRLDDWKTTRMHAASTEARLGDTYPSFEQRFGSRNQCSVHLRLERGNSKELTDEDCTKVHGALPDDSMVWRAGAGLEAKFWVEESDAAAAATRAQQLVADAVDAAHVEGWALTRVHTSTFDEAARLHYFGVTGRATRAGAQRC